ncbi:hypothetical protein NDU88_002813 [Pleurodeles waltl]|uniref:Uncharacterized protein n=1 Tax=Pleurodeles waltl TaxID=8319 RepID=A0AAV7NEP3_PLEWA|nr:hypothetical protein NDU88_002813 [Pleurodeles waltl]
MRGRGSLVDTSRSPPPGRLILRPGTRTRPTRVQGRLFFCSGRPFLLERGCLFQVRPSRPRHGPAYPTRLGGPPVARSGL